MALLRIEPRSSITPPLCSPCRIASRLLWRPHHRYRTQSRTRLTRKLQRFKLHTSQAPLFGFFEDTIRRRGKTEVFFIWPTTSSPGKRKWKPICSLVWKSDESDKFCPLYDDALYVEQSNRAGYLLLGWIFDTLASIWVRRPIHRHPRDLYPRSLMAIAGWRGLFSNTIGTLMPFRNMSALANQAGY